MKIKIYNGDRFFVPGYQYVGDMVKISGAEECDGARRIFRDAPLDPEPVGPVHKETRPRPDVRQVYQLGLIAGKKAFLPGDAAVEIEDPYLFIQHAILAGVSR